MAAISMGCDGEGPLPNKESMSQLRQMFGPTAVDSCIRQAISLCWMCLPEEKRTMDEVERQLHRILDRAIQNARDDGVVFADSDGD